MSNSQTSKIVDSVAVKLIARAAMIVATCALPFGMLMVQRSLNSIDEIGRKIDVMRDQASEVNGTVKLIQQTQNVQTQIIADHETRVRALETFNRNLRP
jgi:hypothetical protein